MSWATHNLKTVLLLNNAFPSEEDPKAGAYVKRIGECLELAGAKVNYLYLSNTFGSKFINYLLFYARIFLRDLNVDVIYFNHYSFYSFPFSIRTIKDKTLVFHWHGLELTTPNPKKTAVVRTVEKLSRRNKIIHIAPSQYYRRFVSQTFQCPDREIEVSASGGVDIDFFTPRSLAEEEVKTRKLKVGFASGLNAQKGVKLLGKLLTDLVAMGCELQVLAYSTDSYGREFLKFAENQNSVSVLPKLDSNRLREFYRDIDILLFIPAAPESLGLTPLEAMSCGTPVLGVNKYAITEYIVPGVSGETFCPDAPGEFKEALSRLTNSLEGYAPRQVIEKSFSMNSIATFYKSILSF